MGTRRRGRNQSRSLYAFYIPTNWNGDAIYYAHGIRPPLEDITLNDQDNFFAVRDALGALGYAFAYSSFSENGLAVKDGVQRTHQLRGLLNSELPNQPQRSYLAGYSLGALAALELGSDSRDSMTASWRCAGWSAERLSSFSTLETFARSSTRIFQGHWTAAQSRPGRL